jgi:hypothetical protein
MHVEIDLLNHIRDIQVSECQILQGVGQAAIMCGVADRVAGVTRKLEGGSTSKGVVCGRLRRMRGRKTDGVHWHGAITPGDHIPFIKILHR